MGPSPRRTATPTASSTRCWRSGDRLSDYTSLSLWHATCGEDLAPRPSLAAASDRRVDVAIIGAGYTGLWTAYYLTEADPSLRMAVLEAEVAGFGASGRNGGWCSALYPVSLRTLADEHGRDAALAQYEAMRASVAEVGRVIDREGLQADWALGGTISLARSHPQLERARAEVAEQAEFGIPSGLLLDAVAAAGRLRATSVLGGVYTPDCAVVHPAKLVRGLARIVESRGVRIHERTRVTGLSSGRVDTEHGPVHADVVVRATEAFTAQLPGFARALVPVYSLMIATEPLPEAVWHEIGLSSRETFADFRHVIIYGQRTADDRMVFGGRGAPYHWGSRIDPRHDRVPSVFADLRRTLVDMLPVLAGVRITHQWGGPLGIARDWHPSVGYDGATGLAWAGGYVGDGVSTSNLAGRTLAAMIRGDDSPLLNLPWVGHRSPQWEREPLRWLGANLALDGMKWADRSEQRRGTPSRLANLVNHVLSR